MVRLSRNIDFFYRNILLQSRRDRRPVRHRMWAGWSPPSPCIWYKRYRTPSSLSNLDNWTHHKTCNLTAAGLPGPEMLKAAILSLGGYQAEFSVYATGLHIEQKAKMFQAMAEKRLEKSKFQTLEFQTYGVSREDPQSQLQSTVQIRQVISWFILSHFLVF